ncbi:hypothetical protein VIGAN_09048400 [Vigna angularis var. angularis]|uniref:Uncharacterized protein n=1 Tax=Vigna angularis var. angularis TaxID=157739 RepID=A0A0S3SW90_PHAAN|nr:hypothetical protein VIGAN_09048400 [Vigna angularis var. angularis]
MTSVESLQHSGSTFFSSSKLYGGSATHLEAIDAEIAVILDEARTSYATHNRKLISLLRAKSSSSVFFSAFSRTLTPLIDFQRRLASVERVVSFVYALAASASDEFLDCFLKFLLAAATTYNKTSRFRACQIVFEMTIDEVKRTAQQQMNRALKDHASNGNKFYKMPNNACNHFHLVVVHLVVAGVVVAVLEVAVLEVAVLVGLYWVRHFELEDFEGLKIVVQPQRLKAEGMAGGR